MSIERYRPAERRLWDHVGVTPTERRLRLPRLDVEVRIQEAGDGPPVVFVHGAPNSGTTWAPLAGHIEGLRCLYLDRPGTGLSDPVALDRDEVPGFADRLIVEVLDALDLERADLVGSSLGGHLALRAAARHPERVGRMVQMGAPGAIEGAPVAPFVRILGLPGVAWLMGRLPASPRAGAMQLRQIGHAASLDAGTISEEFLDWYYALQRDTDTMRNELALTSKVVTFGGFRPETELSSAILGNIAAPTYFLWGDNDAFGDQQHAQDVVAAVPDAELEMLPNAGHLPWLDDPARAATVIHAFLRDRQPVPDSHAAR